MEKSRSISYEDLISSEISKTGYVLEHKIAQMLKAKGWSVISGKYYVDDNEDVPREMDLIAYRVAKIDGDEIEIYTVMIISCKKSEENSWALLARNINLKDPNTDYWPLHCWTNDVALGHQLAISGKQKKYHEGVRMQGVIDAAADPQVEVFAFQEMNKINGSPRNDKAIFNSLTSLVKAQAYEISALPARKKNKAVYQFNLISVVGSDMYRLMFADSGGGVESVPVESEQYIARYIVAKRESFSRIRFLTADGFSESLDDYGRLHNANVKWFAGEHAGFYNDIVLDGKRIEVLMSKFHDKIRFPVKWRLEKNFKGISYDDKPLLNWNSGFSDLSIEYMFNDEVLDFMNEDEGIRGIVAVALKSIYRYVGPFKFRFEIPF